MSISSAYRFVIWPDAVFEASSNSLSGNFFHCPVIALVFQPENFTIAILRIGQAEVFIAAKDAWLEVHARITTLPLLAGHLPETVHA